MGGSAPRSRSRWWRAAPNRHGPWRHSEVRRRGTTRYWMSPLASSSSERVVSFLSRDAEPPGNSFRARAYFAATRTPRYLFAECSAISTGVKTRMIRCSGCGVLYLLLEPLDEQPDLLTKVLQSLPTDHFGIDDRLDARHGALEFVV